MAKEANRYVMVFKGSDADFKSEAAKVRSMSGVAVIHQGRGALLVEVSKDDVGFAGRMEEGGDWIVSKEQIYRIS